MTHLGNVIVLVALLIGILPQTAHADEAVSDSAVQITAEVGDVDDDERTSFVEESSLEHPAEDERPGEALDESSDGLEELEMAGRGHKRKKHPRLGKAVELGRHRTPLLPEKYFLLPLGNRLYCIIDADPIAFEEWSQKDHNACVGFVALVGGAIALGFVNHFTLGLGNTGAGIVFGFGGWIGGIVGDELCPGPDTPKPTQYKPAPPIGTGLQNPFGNIGIPCPCPDPGCGCGAGCGCGCGNGASCGCGVCDVGGGV